MNSSILDVDELLRDDSFMPLVEDEVLNTATFYLKQWKARADELESNAEPALNATVTIQDNGGGAGGGVDIPPPTVSTLHHRFGINPKLVDTRTFTRPKKQQFQPMPSSRNAPFLNNETMVLGGGQSPKGPGINLQIGGLVTSAGRGVLPIAMTQSSMQKSLIGDTSPPSSICSSTIDLAAERLMLMANSNNGAQQLASGEFANETFPNGGGGDTNSLNGYNMEDVRREIEMLQNLTAEGECAPVPAAVPEADATMLIDRQVPKVNETFLEKTTTTTTLQNNGQGDVNGTFDLIGEDDVVLVGGQTIVIAGGGAIAEGEGEGEGEEDQEQNSTFNLTKLVKDAKTTTAVADEESSLQRENKDRTVLIEKVADQTMIVEEDDIHLEFGRGLESFIQSTPICRDKAKQNDMFNFSPTGNEHMYRTIEMNMRNNNNNSNAFKVPLVPPQRFLDRAAVNDVTMPVDSEDGEKEVVDEKTLVPANTIFLSKTTDLGQTHQMDGDDDELQSSPEFEDLPELRQKTSAAGGPVPVDQLRPEERQSLVNFEEYEKSLQLLDDNRNERDFDDMLASINTQDMRKSGERMRQSLDSIKKRHSLINYERQQEELRRKVNDIDQEINNLTMMEGSVGGGGGGPRLLNRRSRLFDEQQENVQENVMNRTMDLSTATSLQQQQQGQQPPLVERRAVPEKRDRDRFKTIKIFRKTVNSNIPDADETSIDGVLEGDENNGVGESEGGGVAQQQQEEGEAAVEVVKSSGGGRSLQRPSRFLTRPKFGSGLQRPSHLGIATQKASSADDLLDSRRGGEEEEEEEVGRREVSQERGHSVQRMNPSRMTTGKLKSPMGIKSKSIHNLMVNGGGGGGGQSRIGSGMSSRIGTQQEMRPFSTNTFKVNRMGGSSGAVSSSGYASGTYQRPSVAGKATTTSGVNMRQTKSIGGVQRPVSAVLPQSYAAVNRRQEALDSYSDVNIPEARLEPRLAAPRASGLRPPSGIARPSVTGGVRSGLPRLSGIPRR